MIDHIHKHHSSRFYTFCVIVSPYLYRNIVLYQSFEALEYALVSPPKKTGTTRLIYESIPGKIRGNQLTSIVPLCHAAHPVWHVLSGTVELGVGGVA
jgi:hypothetical protein